MQSGDIQVRFLLPSDFAGLQTFCGSGHVLCKDEPETSLFRYAHMEMGFDSPDLPMGMVSDLHLKRCVFSSSIYVVCINFSA